MWRRVVGRCGAELAPCAVRYGSSTAAEVHDVDYKPYEPNYLRADIEALFKATAAQQLATAAQHVATAAQHLCYRSATSCTRSATSCDRSATSFLPPPLQRNRTARAWTDIEARCGRFKQPRVGPKLNRARPSARRESRRVGLGAPGTVQRTWARSVPDTSGA